jgi:hypothetical protein
MVNDMLYFALTEEEVLKGILHYPKTKKYQLKAVHTSLPALRDFIKQNFHRDYASFYYTTIQEEEVTIDENVYRENDVVAVKLPITLSLKNRKIEPLFPRDSVGNESIPHSLFW